MGNINTVVDNDTRVRKTCYYYVDDEDKQMLRYSCCARINLDVSFGRTSYLLSDLEPLVKEAFASTGHLYLWEENDIAMVKWDKSIDELLEFVTENPLFEVDESPPRFGEDSSSEEVHSERIRGYKFYIPGLEDEESVNQEEDDDTSHDEPETKKCDVCKGTQTLDGRCEKPCVDSIYHYHNFNIPTLMWRSRNCE